MLTHDGRQPIAKGHLNDSGDLKVGHIFKGKLNLTKISKVDTASGTLCLKMSVSYIYDDMYYIYIYNIRYKVII